MLVVGVVAYPLISVIWHGEPPSQAVYGFLAVWGSVVLGLIWPRAIPVLLAAWTSALLAQAIMHESWLRVVAAAAGIIACSIVIWRLEVGIVAVLILAASIIEPDVIPRPFSFGGQGPRVTELLILLMVVIVYARESAQRRFEYFKSPMMLPLLLFFAAAAMSVAVSYTTQLHETSKPWDFHWIYNLLRPLTGYLLFIPVAFGLRTERQLRSMLRLVMWLAVAVAVLMVVQQLLGERVSLFIGGRVTEAYVRQLSADLNEEVAGGVVRFAAPGLALILWLFLVALAQAAYKGVRLSVTHAAAAAVLGIGLVFSFTRHFWISTLLSVLIIALVTRGKVGRRIILTAAVAGTVAVLGTLSLGSVAPRTAGAKFSSALHERFASILSPNETLRTESLQNRFRENRYAIRSIKRSPIFGIGVGSPAHYKEAYNYWYGSRVLFPVYWIHNSYLELWMLYGLFGIGSFAWLSIAFLIRSFTLFRRAREPEWQALGVAFFAAYIGYLERCVTQMHILHDAHHIVAVAFMWGIVEVIWRINEESVRKAGGPELTSPAEETAVGRRAGAHVA